MAAKKKKAKQCTLSYSLLTQKFRKSSATNTLTK